MRRRSRTFPLAAPRSALLLFLLLGAACAFRGRPLLPADGVGSAVVEELDGIPFADVAAQHRPGELRLELRADLPPQLPRAEFRLVSHLREVVDEGVVELQRQSLALRHTLHPLQLQTDDLADLRPVQSVE